jgi:hypothetical protein
MAGDKPFYADLFNLTEDDRIAIIGQQVEQGLTVGFVVEDDDKADRYIEKLMNRFRVDVVTRGSGPVKDTILVKVGPRAGTSYR